MKIWVYGWAIMASALFTLPATAEPLSGDALRKTIAGKTVIMTMNLGSLPITYRSNGTMSASSSAIGMVTGIPSDSGRWWVSGRNLCQKWKKWFEGRQFCHAMSKKGGTLYWVRNDGLSGSATVN